MLNKLRALYARIFKPEGLVVLSCKDVTEDFYHKEGERIFRVEYYKRGYIHVHYISYSGEYSENNEIALLQRYCVERVKHV